MTFFTTIKEKLQGKIPNGARRSKEWPAVRRRFLEANPRCAVCGGVEKLEVHHMIPFHLDPTKELDFSNLISLCESKKRGVNCHLFFGHIGSYRRFNPDILLDALAWSIKLNKTGK